jgi:phospholipid transport system substrate-binding protein
MSKIVSVLGWLGLAFLLVAAPAAAASPAETFVSQNIDKGLQILNNRSLSSGQRASQFQTFLEGLTDLGRIAKFTLGNARRGAPDADVAAFDAAFRNYAYAVYQSRLSAYTGQSLKVTGSTERSADDIIVKTVLVDPKQSGQQPLEVDFRVRSDTGRMAIVDVAIAGVWLAIEERDQFSAFLGQHNGDIKQLVTHLNQLTAQLKAKTQ